MNKKNITILIVASIIVLTSFFLYRLYSSPVVPVSNDKQETPSKISITKAQLKPQNIESELAPEDDVPSLIYTIENGSLGEYTSSIEDHQIEKEILTKADALWGVYTEASPTNYLQYISEFRIFNSSQDDTGAYVALLEVGEIGSSWELGVNFDAAKEDGEVEVDSLFGLMLHEFAHVFSLNSTQLTSDSESECETLYVAEGCLHQGAHIYEFYQRFWLGREDHEENLNAVQEYQTNPENYVSEYAATSLGEDFAETFVAYMFEEEFCCIAQDKVNFMQTTEEIVRAEELIFAQ